MPERDCENVSVPEMVGLALSVSVLDGLLVKLTVGVWKCVGVRDGDTVGVHGPDIVKVAVVVNVYD